MAMTGGIHGRRTLDRNRAADIPSLCEQLHWPPAHLSIQEGRLLSYRSCEARVPESHPLRVIRAIVDEALEVLSPQLAGVCADTVDTSIALGKLLRSLLLEAFYTIRSERELIEQRL